jgi:hypothetical protein
MNDRDTTISSLRDRVSTQHEPGHDKLEGERCIAL